MNTFARFRRVLPVSLLLLAGTTALACTDNLYFPVVSGASWTYAMQGGQMTQSITDVRSDSFTVRMDMDLGGTAESTEVTYTCGPDGGIRTGGFSPDLLDPDMGIDVEIEVLEQDGNDLPADWTVGHSWPTYVELQMIMRVEGMPVTSTMTTDTVSTIVGIESVTVPAGTFEALRMSTEGTVTTMTSMMGIQIPFTVDSDSSIWFVEGVGMVLNISEDSRMELISYTIP